LTNKRLFILFLFISNLVQHFEQEQAQESKAQACEFFTLISTRFGDQRQIKIVASHRITGVIRQAEGAFRVLQAGFLFLHR